MITMTQSLDPQLFSLWQAPDDRFVTTGADTHPVPLPAVPLPVHVAALLEGEPSDAAIGQGIYDYLRQFPDCAHNLAYAELLRDAYPHFLTDLASHAIMLDAKEVDPAYILRKLTYLKILHLLEPANAGLLLQLCRGFFDLALTFSEFHASRRHLLEAMRFGQKLLRLRPDDPSSYGLLAEIDVLFADYPGAEAKWQGMLAQVDDPGLQGRIRARMAEFRGRPLPETTLVDDLETVHLAMQAYLAGDFAAATGMLEKLEEDQRFVHDLPCADFFCLLGLCRLKNSDPAGAFAALNQALEIDPAHAVALETLDAFHAREH